MTDIPTTNSPPVLAIVKVRGVCASFYGVQKPSMLVRDMPVAVIDFYKTATPAVSGATSSSNFSSN